MSLYMIYHSILDVLRLWNIITHWFISHYIWKKCSRNLRGCYECIYDLPFDDLCFDIQCAETLIYIHALILQPLHHLEVLAIFWYLWVMWWSTFWYSMCWDSDIYSCIDPSAATSGSARHLFWHLQVMMRWSTFRYSMCWDSDIYSCIDPSAATSGSACDFLVPKSDEMIYISIFIWYIFMHWSFSRYIWKCSQFIFAPTSDEMIDISIFIVLRLWYIFGYEICLDGGGYKLNAITTAQFSWEVSRINASFIFHGSHVWV